MSPRRLLPLPSGPGEPFEGYGTVASVEILQAGTELVGDHTSGVSVLQVLDVSGIPGEGTVLVGGDELPYTATDDLTDPDTTAANETITLAAATTSSYPARALVTLLPVREYKEALVVLDAAPEKAVTCLVDHKLEDNLDEGPRAAGAGEIVWVRQRRGELTLTVETIKGRRKKVDGGYLDGRKSLTPGAVERTFAQHESELAAAVPPSTLGGGQSNADINWQGRLKSNAFETTAQGTIVRLPDGAGALLIRPDGTVQHIAATGDFDDLVSRKTVLAGVTKGAPGGTFILEDTGMLDPPSQPPVTDPNWLTAPLALPSSIRPQHLFGVGVKDATHAFCMRRISNGQARVVKFNPTTGDVAIIIASDQMTGAPTMATVVDADYQSRDGLIQTLEYDAGAQEWLVRLYDFSTLAFDHEWVCTQLGSLPDPQPAIASFCDPDTGIDEYTRVLQSNPDGTVNIHRFHNEVFVTTSVTTDSFVWGNSGSLDLVACATYGGILLIAGRRNVITDASTWPGIPENTPVIPVIDMGLGGFIGPTLGYLQAAYGELTCAGLGAIDTDLNYRTWSISAGSGLVVQQSTVLEAGGWWTSPTYYDSINDLETAWGTPTLEVKIPGSNTTYTEGKPPPGSTANKIRIYLARDMGAGVPARTDFHLNAESNPDEWHADVFTVDLTTDPPPATGNLPSGDPFKFKLPDGTLLFAGDGTGVFFGGGGSSGTDDDFVYDEETGDIFIYGGGLP